MSNSVIRTIAVVSFLFSGAYANEVTEAHYNLRIVSWIGDDLHIEVKTDLPDGTELTLGISNEKTGDNLSSYLVRARVSGGTVRCRRFRDRQRRNLHLDRR